MGWCGSTRWLGGGWEGPCADREPRVVLTNVYCATKYLHKLLLARPRHVQTEAAASLKRMRNGLSDHHRDHAVLSEPLLGGLA